MNCFDVGAERKAGGQWWGMIRLPKNGKTAPKDGTIIDVWLGDCDEGDRQFYCTGDTRRSAGWWWSGGKFRPLGGLHPLVPVFVEPTHWMPIPKAPK